MTDPELTDPGLAASADAPKTPSLPGSARRILIYGVTGSGKSTLAEKLSALTEIPAHLVDEELGWLADWTPRPVAEISAMVSEAVAADSWIFDSAYATFRDLVLPRTELILGLDYSRLRTLYQLVRRTRRRITSEEPICNGNIETWRSTLSKDSILSWHFKSFSRKRSVLRRLAATAAVDPASPRVILFKNPGQCAAWLRSLEFSSGASGTNR